MPAKRDRRLAAVVLAAGESTRFGGPKLLAEVGGASLLERVLDAATNQVFERCIVVLGARAGRLVPVVARFPRAEVCLNEKWGEGRATSFQAALSELAGFDGVAIFAADRPFTSPQVTRQVAQDFLAGDYEAAYPVHGGRRGNPVLFARAAYRRFAELKGEEGGESVIRKLSKVLEVEVDEPVELDVNTKAELSRANNLASLLQHQLELVRESVPHATARLVQTTGSTPRETGAFIVVTGVDTHGSIGGGAFEAEVVHRAREILADGGGSALIEMSLTPAGLGMLCAGNAQVYIETHRPRPRLVIYGGGHVGQALARLVSASGLFRTTVLDDREEYSDPARFPPDVEASRTDGGWESGPSLAGAYAVVVTRCHDTDLRVVGRLLSEPLKYLGMIGSKSKAETTRRELLKAGATEEQLKRLHAPVGLPIGGKTPQEIAVSVLAQLVQVKNGVTS